MNHSTIVAISTAPGIGGIAVIRVSGSEAILLCDQVFQPKNKSIRFADQIANTVVFGSVVDKTEETIDDVLVSIFRAPYSFTCEDVVEISCHGSVFIQQQILHLLIEKGCRLAMPGEFTQRAFLNGKMDLTQAEAIADLIQAGSEAALQLANRQLEGNF